MNKKQAKRLTVDYAHIGEIEKLECVVQVLKQPRLVVLVRSELTPDYGTIARMGDTIEVETRRRYPWVQPHWEAPHYGKVYANKRLTAGEGGDE